MSCLCGGVSHGFTCFCDEEVSDGFTYRQLRRAFDSVADPEDWRGPVHNPWVSGDRLLVVSLAVEFFTATKLSAEPNPTDPRYFVVDAAGYRNGPAGP